MVEVSNGNILSSFFEGRHVEACLEPFLELLRFLSVRRASFSFIPDKKPFLRPSEIITHFQPHVFDFMFSSERPFRKMRTILEREHTRLIFLV